MNDPIFLTHLQQHYLSHQGKDAFKSLREKSWQRLLELGLPDKSHEAFRYVSLRELYPLSFGFPNPKLIDKSLFFDAILPECKHSHLIFIDGRFSPDLSDISALPPQTLLLPLDEAIQSHASFLQHHFSFSIKEESDPFTLVNFALHANGVFFYLPPKLEATSPVQSLHLFTGSEPIIACPRLYLTAGAQSRLHWINISHHFQSGASHLILPATEISLEDGASLDLLNVVDEAQGTWHLESVRANLKKNARFRSLHFTFGAKAVRQSYRVHLKGENSEADLKGLWMLSKNRTAHTHAVVEHEAPYTRSMQLFKGVLSDASQSSFEGQILVQPEAQKTEAYQLNNNLILSRGAVANCKPNLEIFADDVKASHGATVSQLDQEQLFYLTTRGIDPNCAKRLLIGGFCREIIERIPYDLLLQRMLHHVESLEPMTPGAS
jgi:Fe-S cluster assembly protein SufD